MSSRGWVLRRFGQPRRAVIIENDGHPEVWPCLEGNLDRIDLLISFRSSMLYGLADQLGLFGTDIQAANNDPPPRPLDHVDELVVKLLR